MRLTLGLLPVASLIGSVFSAIGDPCSVAQGDGHCDKIEACKDVGWTVPGACPHDGNNVRCCIRQRCAVDRFEGKCLDSALTQCTDGNFKTWLCRGGNNVQCCIKNGPNDAFVDYIRTLYDLAQSYQPNGSPNLRVMEWLRHADYHGPEWWAVLGSMDNGYLDLVKNKGVAMIEWLNDSLYAEVKLKISHMGACMNGAFLKGIQSGTSVNFADFTCWGGDLITFYAEWRRDVDQYPSGKQYALERLAKIRVDSTFKLRDLLEDAWGWNIGMMLRSDTRLSIVQEMQQQLTPGGEYRTRIKRFVDDRFRGHMREIVKEMLVSTDDTKLATARAALIELSTVGAKLPGSLPVADLDGFVDGVVTVIEQELRSERDTWDDTAPPGAPGHDEL